MNSNKKLLAVIPCTNHFLAGMLIKMSSNNKNIIKIAHVCEGTLNYYNRFTTFTEVLKRLFKKFTSLIFNFLSFYHLEIISMLFLTIALLSQEIMILIQMQKKFPL